MMVVKTWLSNPGAEEYIIKGMLLGANLMHLGGILLYLRGWASGSGQLVELCITTDRFLEYKELHHFL